MPMTMVSTSSFIAVVGIVGIIGTASAFRSPSIHLTPPHGWVTVSPSPSPLGGCWATTPLRPHHLVSGLGATDGSDEYDTSSASTSATSAVPSPGPAPSTEYDLVAVPPGGRLRIRVGDPRQARKAWKKRRRSTSPILVPCSLLGINRHNAVRWNVAYLLHRHGTPTPATGIGGDDERGGGSKDGGVSMAVGAMGKLYKREMGGNLLDHAHELGFDTVGDMLLYLFDAKAQMKEGIEVVRHPNGHLVLVSNLSRRRARESASRCGTVQVRFHPDDPDPDDDDDAESAAHRRDHRRSLHHLPHTGFARSRPRRQHVAEAGDGGNAAFRADPRRGLEPLSAAVRVPQRDGTDGDSSPSSSSDGPLRDGDEVMAYVLGLDPGGDDGAPLITLSIDPPRGQRRLEHKIRSSRDGRRAEDRREKELSHPGKFERTLDELNVGDGPIPARVVRLSARAGAAFVDCGVGRRLGKSRGGGNVPVLGMLRFDDLLEKARRDGMLCDGGEEEANETTSQESRPEGDDDGAHRDDDSSIFMQDQDWNEGEEWDGGEEMIEDITSLFSTDEAGNLFAVDPETGERREIESEEIIYDDGNENDMDEDLFEGMTPEERLEAIGSMLDDEGNEEACSPPAVARATSVDGITDSEPKSSASFMVQVGDEVKVYIKAVSRQSQRFLVTLDPSVKGKTAKGLKQEKSVDKKLNKLITLLGGEDGVRRILSMKGTECQGIIKAKSNTGDWFYVQPVVEEMDLPVGVGLNDGSANVEAKPGDRVKIRLNGIDNSRGQLAMIVLGKVES